MSRTTCKSDTDRTVGSLKRHSATHQKRSGLLEPTICKINNVWTFYGTTSTAVHSSSLRYNYTTLFAKSAAERKRKKTHNFIQQSGSRK